MIRVLIVDDHPIVRKGLQQIVSNEPGLTVAGETGDARVALSMAAASPFDVVVLDLNLPGMPGLEALSRLRVMFPLLPVLILSTHPERDFALRVLKAGAAGYLNKDLAPEELVAAIRRIATGRRYVSEEVADLLAASLNKPDEAPHSSLSSREYQVLLAIAAGRTVSEIAADMFLSVKTVSSYRARILEKMHMRNNAELMRYAMEAGLTGRET